MIVREGFDALEPAEEKEDDLLDKAWGLEPTSRLSCQALVTDTPLVIEIPKYTINMVSEGKHDEMDRLARHRHRAGGRSIPTSIRRESTSWT